MRKPFSIHSSITASGTVVGEKTIPLVRARTVSLTVRLTFGASIDADTTVYLYYSPDGNNWDTIAYTSFVIAYTASATKQRTCLIDVPEHGSIMVKVTNGSSADTISNVQMWYTIQSWEEVGAEVLGRKLKVALGKEQREETGRLQ